jgi:hypothetical protein
MLFIQVVIGLLVHLSDDDDDLHQQETCLFWWLLSWDIPTLHIKIASGATLWSLWLGLGQGLKTTRCCWCFHLQPNWNSVKRNTTSQHHLKCIWNSRKICSPCLRSQSGFDRNLSFFNLINQNYDQNVPHLPYVTSNSTTPNLPMSYWNKTENGYIPSLPANLMHFLIKLF